MGSAAQAAVEIGGSAPLDDDLRALSLSEEKLAELLAVPQLVRAGGSTASASTDLYGGLAVDVRPAEGTKCPRCWQVRRDTGEEGLCDRCRKVVRGLVRPA